MCFEQLSYVTKLVSQTTRHHKIVGEWDLKRQQLYMQLYDFPGLIEAYKNALKVPYKNTNIKLVEKVPRLRLANACEATVGNLYAMAEVASQFANRISSGRLPASFNALQKKVDSARVEQTLVDQLGDLQWYRKVREMRTEWVHYSTIFICENDSNEPMVSVRAYRRPSDKLEIPSQTQYLITEVSEWIQKAIATLDAYACYLLNQYVLPSLDKDQVVTIPKYDEKGFPIVLEGGGFDVEQITIEEYLRRGRIGVVTP